MPLSFTFTAAVSHAPKRPRVSIHAEHAELVFASRVTELGWIQHLVLAERDVGIDGRVELVVAWNRYAG